MRFLTHTAHITPSSLIAPARCVRREGMSTGESRETNAMTSFEGARIRAQSIRLYGTDEARYGSIVTGLEMFCSQRGKDLLNGDRLPSDLKKRHLDTLKKMREAVMRVDGYNNSAVAKEILAIVAEVERKVNSFQEKATDYQSGVSGVRRETRGDVDNIRGGTYGAGYIFGRGRKVPDFDRDLAQMGMITGQMGLKTRKEPEFEPLARVEGADIIVDETRLHFKRMTADQWASA